MADVTVKKLEEFDGAFGGNFKLIRAGLGVSSFGIQLIQMPPNADQYPEHDHMRDGQEEVYSALDGRATLQAGGEEHELVPGVYARVGSGEKRKIVTDSEGATVLAIGATPGKAYEIPEFTKPAEATA